jgi:HK97 family phage major capsid protein
VSLERAALLSQAHSILSKPGTFSKEDNAKVESLLALADSLTDDDAKDEMRKAKLKRMARETGRGEPVFATRQPSETDPERLTAADRHLLALAEYLRTGRSIRAYLGVGTGSTGGFLAPQPFADRVAEMMQQWDDLFSIATPWISSTGEVSGFPIIDDVASSAAIVAEQGTSSIVEIAAFNKTPFGLCPTFRSGQVIASVELCDDSHFDLTAILTRAFAVRFARGIGSYLVGVLLDAAATGLTTASATAIAGAEIYGLIDSLNPAWYPKAAFLMTHATFTSILKLTGSGSGNFLFPYTVNGTGRPTLAGFPVYFSPSMPAMTAGLQSVAFGDLSMMLRREVAGSLQIHTYRELFAASGSIGWEAFWRVDGGLLLSGSQVPVNCLVQHA